VAKMKEWMPWEPLVGKAPPTQWQWPWLCVDSWLVYWSVWWVYISV
jgi:hypothetical protein